MTINSVLEGDEAQQKAPRERCTRKVNYYSYRNNGVRRERQRTCTYTRCSKGVHADIVFKRSSACIYKRFMTRLRLIAFYRSVNTRARSEIPRRYPITRGYSSGRGRKRDPRKKTFNTLGEGRNERTRTTATHSAVAHFGGGYEDVFPGKHELYAIS